MRRLTAGVRAHGTQGDVEAEMDEKPGVPENHESHPAVKRLLAKRTPHAGPWMKLTWPPHSSKPPIHMHLNYRQFVEDGHLPDPRRSKGINSRAWVSYLAVRLFPVRVVGYRDACLRDVLWLPPPTPRSLKPSSQFFFCACIRTRWNLRIGRLGFGTGQRMAVER